MNSINIMLVSHTNAGKTTLVRTLLGTDVGEVLDAPDVTLSVSDHALAAGPDGSSLRLWDTPGFGDSFRLSKRLNGNYPWLAWPLRELWDRYRNPRLWRGQRVACDIRQRADVILYLVNSVERPVDAVYVAPEIDVLAWTGKPVLVVLNQVGDNPTVLGASTPAQEWRTALAAHSGIAGVLELDSFSRCWVQELTLYDAIGQVLPAPRRLLYAELAQSIRAGHSQRLNASTQALSAYLLKAATDRVELPSGWFEKLKDVWGAIHHKIPWTQVDQLQPHEQAMQGLAQRFMESTQAVSDELIAINRLSGVTSAEIVQASREKFFVDAPVDEVTTTLAGGIISGALTGLVADLVSGGLTLGAGALAGAALGAAGSAVLAAGYNMYTAKGKKMIGWSQASLVDAFEKSLLLYLAIAHFGRGQGAWQRKKDSEYWRQAVATIVQRDRGRIQQLWIRAETEGPSLRAKAECTSVLQSMLVELLGKRYPDALQQIGPSV